MNMAGLQEKFLQYSFLVFLIILLSLTAPPPLQKRPIPAMMLSPQKLLRITSIMSLRLIEQSTPPKLSNA